LGTFAQHIDQVFFLNRFLMEQGIGSPVRLIAVLGQQFIFDSQVAAPVTARLAILPPN
jgi:hypothetical protein